VCEKNSANPWSANSVEALINKIDKLVRQSVQRTLPEWSKHDVMPLCRVCHVGIGL